MCLRVLSKVILISFPPCATPLDVGWDENQLICLHIQLLRLNLGVELSHITSPQASINVIWQELTSEGHGNASKLAAGAVLPCPALLGHCSTFLWALTYISHAHVRSISPPGLRGHLVFLPFCVSNETRKWSGQHPQGWALLILNWTCSDQWIPHQFLYKHQVDVSLSQQSRMTLGTLLRCTSTLLAYVYFKYIYFRFYISIFHFVFW